MAPQKPMRNSYTFVCDECCDIRSFIAEPDSSLRCTRTHLSGEGPSATEIRCGGHYQVLWLSKWGPQPQGTRDQAGAAG